MVMADAPHSELACRLGVVTATLTVAGIGSGIFRVPADIAASARTTRCLWVPLVYVLGVAVILANAIVATPLSTRGGIGISLLGIPIRPVRRRRHG